MSELRDFLEDLKTSLTLALPHRTVTRDLRDFAERGDSELSDGVLTIVALGERDYATHLGREAQLGTLPLLLVGQIRVAENTAPSAIEDAEFALVEDVIAWVRARPTGMGGVVMKGFRQSGQVEWPYGWVAIDIEVLR